MFHIRQQRRWRRTTSSCILIVLLLQTIISSTTAFLNPHPTRRRSRHFSDQQRHHDQHQVRPKSLSTTPTTSLHLTLQDIAATLATDPTDPEVKATVLRDVSHIALDLVVLFSPATIILRLSILIGRLLGVEADYLPDGRIATDELLFDIPLILISAFLVARSGWPILRAALMVTPERTSALDDMVFHQLFQPAGVNWVQYRTMLASGIIDWITPEPGTLLQQEEDDSGELAVSSSHEGSKYLYWLFEGVAVLSYKGEILHKSRRTKGKSINDPAALGFLGDMQFLYALDKDTTDQFYHYPMPTIRVGDATCMMANATTTTTSTTLMRIDTHKMMTMMEHDDELTTSMRLLLLKSIQRKVGALLRARAQPPSSVLLGEDDMMLGEEAEQRRPSDLAVEEKAFV